MVSIIFVMSAPPQLKPCLLEQIWPGNVCDFDPVFIKWKITYRVNSPCAVFRWRQRFLCDRLSIHTWSSSCHKKNEGRGIFRGRVWTQCQHNQRVTNGDVRALFKNIGHGKKQVSCLQFYIHTCSLLSSWSWFNDPEDYTRVSSYKRALKRPKLDF